MEDDAYGTPRMARWRRWTDTPLLILAIGSLPLLLLEIERDLNRRVLRLSIRSARVQIANRIATLEIAQGVLSPVK